MNNQHTPTPWKGPCAPDSNFQKGTVTIKSADTGEVIASLTTRREKDAAFIVKAANYFDELVEMVERMRFASYQDADEEDRKADELLAKVRS